MARIEVKEIRPGCFPEQHGDWIDLKAGNSFSYAAGDFLMIPLGVAMKLPEGYEAHVLPRSSTFKKYGVILVNGMGIIDNAYSGDGDEWIFPALAMRAGEILCGDRIAQFRIVRNMESVELARVPHLAKENRGGFGSTGV